MGRCMFFTVLLCLVLSLSEGTITAKNGNDTTTSGVLTTEGPTPVTNGSSTTTTTAVLTTEGNSSTTTENSTATSSSSATPGPTPVTNGSSTTTTTAVLTTEGNSSTTTENSTATSSSSATPGPTPVTNGSSTTTTTAVLTTEGNSSTTTENSTATSSSSATPESSSTTTVETSTTSETAPTGPTPVTNGSSTTTTTAVLTTEGNSSTTTENSTATSSSSATPGPTPVTNGSSTTTTTAVLTTEGNSSTTTENSTATSSSSATPGPTPVTNGSSTTTTTAVLTTEGNSSTTTENSTATSSSSATPGPTPVTNGSSTTTTTAVLTTEGNSSTTTENSTATSSSSATPGHTSTTTWETSTTSATPTVEELCKPNPCGSKLSTCVPLNTTHICQCPYGFYYYSKNCHTGKVFPGIITLAQMLSDIGNVNSMEYEKMVENITQFFEKAFENMTDYKQTIIVKVNYTEGTSTRSVNNPMTVTVMNIFTEDTNETNTEVEKAIKTAAANSNYVIDYTNTTQCAVYPCDDATTVCEYDTYPVCVCKANFTKTVWDTYSCSDCVNCTAEENMFCDRQSNTPNCKCMDNFKKEGEKCVRCPVGYSGKNCENNKELILIIVGTVFGAIILCLVAAVSIVSVRAKHSHDPEKKRLIKPRNSNSNTSEETRIFPRVQTTSGHANPGYQPNNPYEVHSSSRGDFVEKDYDDLYEISRQPEGFRLQRR